MFLYQMKETTHMKQLTNVSLSNERKTHKKQLTNVSLSNERNNSQETVNQCFFIKG